MAEEPVSGAAREEVLARIRAALGDVPASEEPEDVSVERGYRAAGSDAPGTEPVVERFEERLREYRAAVRRVIESEVAAAVLDECRKHRVKRLVVPRDLPIAWRPGELEVVEDRELSTEVIERADGALTGCAVAIAETGTLLLDGHGLSGRRAITLIPDRHICVVAADQVVAFVPEGISRLTPAAQRGLPVTFVSGPSATSDIELSRVEGVHGPRQLIVLIVEH